MKRLEQLIAAFLDDSLTPAETHELEALLQEDEALDFFFAEVELDDLIAWRYATEEVDRQAEQLLKEVADTSQLSSKSPCDAKEKTALLKVCCFFAQPTPFSITVAALVMIALVSAMALMVPPFYRMLTRNEEQLPSGRYDIVAEVTGKHEVQWANANDSLHRGAFLTPGRQLRLKEGLLEITYRSGARLILEGPCEYEVTGSGTGSLQRGKLAAYVSEQARSFAIDVPGGQIVDLGTEFAVAVDDQGNAFTEVIDGIVEVHRLRDGETVASMRLQAGEAAKLRIGSQVVNESEPRRDFALSLPQDHDTPGGLIGHWKFDDQAPGNTTGIQAADASSSNLDAKYAGSGAINWIAGKSGSAFQLGGNDSRYEIADSSKLRVTGAVSVTAWIRPTAPSTFGVIAGIDQIGGSESDMYSLKVNGSDAPQWQVISGGGGSDVIIDADDTLTNFSDETADGWVHLVGVFDPRVGAYLYVNGELNVADHTSVPSEIQWAPTTPFQIGHNASNRGGNPLHAAVDEIQIYARVLTAEEVSFLFHNPGTVVSPEPTE